MKSLLHSVMVPWLRLLSLHGLWKVCVCKGKTGLKQLNTGQVQSLQTLPRPLSGGLAVHVPNCSISTIDCFFNFCVFKQE